jgi:D-alanine--poly(phosphoribitol) ligase subunit 1
MTIDNIVDAVNVTSNLFPDKIAYKYFEETITHIQLKKKSDALACYLIDKFGYNKSPIIVYGHKQFEMIICFLACQKAGHPYVPVECSLPANRIKDIIENSGTRFLFNIHEQEIDFPDRKNRAEINELITSYHGSVPPDEYKVKNNDLFYILYTSGSTGKPKGVQITHDNLRSFLNWLLKVHTISDNIEALSHDEIYMCQVNYSFDVSCMSIYPALLMGSSLYAIDKEMIKNLKVLFENLKKSQISVWISTPALVEMCLTDSSFATGLMPNLRLVFLAGEVLPNKCVSQLHKRFKGIKVINGYGPTEATVLITAIEIDKALNETVSPLPVGRALDDCNLMIIDEKGNEVPEGTTGEIHVYGEPVSPGYLNNPEMTAKSFYKKRIDGKKLQCYKTGDSGYLKGGILYYKGRIDFQVKLYGNRIELEDIENNIRKLDYINSVVVLPVFVDSKVKYLHAVITLKRELNQSPFKTTLKIKKELKALIPDFMIPRKFTIKESLPMNLSGKIDRKVLMSEITALDSI